MILCWLVFIYGIRGIIIDMKLLGVSRVGVGVAL